MSLQLDSLEDPRRTISTVAAVIGAYGPVFVALAEAGWRGGDELQNGDLATMLGHAEAWARSANNTKAMDACDILRAMADLQEAYAGATSGYGTAGQIDAAIALGIYLGRLITRFEVLYKVKLLEELSHRPNPRSGGRARGLQASAYAHSTWGEAFIEQAIAVAPKCQNQADVLREVRAAWTRGQRLPGDKQLRKKLREDNGWRALLARDLS